MYRATCNCGKFNVLRSHVLQSWSSRKCKSCKSNFKVYLDNLIVYDYNNPGDRARSRMTNYIGRDLFKNKVRVNPKITFSPPPTPPPTPIIKDVFLGYQGVQEEYDGPKYMINPYFEEPKVLFDFEFDI